jgi:hypothetical protein
VRVVGIDVAGHPWFGTMNGVSWFNGSSWTSYTAKDGLAGNLVEAIAMDPSGSIWFGSGGVSELYPILQLAKNYPNGAPGSYFNITGSGYPPSQNTELLTNGVVLGTLAISSSGTFSATLSTTNSDEGSYSVTASINPKISVRFILDTHEPSRSQEGSLPILQVPPGIAYTQEVFLPLVKR